MIKHILKASKFLGYNTLFEIDNLISYEKKEKTVFAAKINGCDHSMKVGIHIPAYIAFQYYAGFDSYHIFTSSPDYSKAEYTLYELGEEGKTTLISFVGRLPSIIDKKENIYLIESIG